MTYHVRITSRDPLRRSNDALALDKDAAWIEEHVVAPRREGRDIFIDGQVFSWDSIDEIHITETDQTSGQLLPQIRARRQRDGISVPIPARWYVAKDGQEVTEQFISGPPGTGPRPDPTKATAFAKNRKAVMVIYGHDEQANDALFGWLRAIGLHPREWSQLIRATGSASPYIGEVLDKALRDVQAVVAFFTPDEYVTAAETDRGRGRLQARPNVLIEAGMALIAHPTRTIIAVLGDQELPSDLAGRHYVRLSHTDVDPLNDLAGRLGDAGCDIDLSGRDWLHPSRFPDRDSTALVRERPASQTRRVGTEASPPGRNPASIDTLQPEKQARTSEGTQPPAKDTAPLVDSLNKVIASAKYIKGADPSNVPHVFGAIEECRDTVSFVERVLGSPSFHVGDEDLANFTADRISRLRNLCDSMAFLLRAARRGQDPEPNDFDKFLERRSELASVINDIRAICGQLNHPFIKKFLS